MEKQLLTKTRLSQLLYSLCLLLLCVNLGWGATVAADVATNGNYRTLNSGDWSNPSTWQVRTAGIWATATVAPGSANTVYIQSGHTVLVDGAVASCYSLHINVAGVVTIGANILEVNGKIRLYTGAAVVTVADGAYIGTDSIAMVSTILSTTSPGVLKFVGGTRTITFAGEWANTTTNNACEFALSTGMGTFIVGVRFFPMVISSGIAFASSCDFSVGSGDFTIESGATFFASKSNSVNGVIGNDALSACNKIEIKSGGTLRFNSRYPKISCNTFVNNGTVLYDRGALQDLVVKATPVATGDLSQYSTLTLGGSGVKIAKSAITVSKALNFTGVETLTVTATNKLTMLNNSTLGRYSNTVGQLPSTAGAVEYGLLSTDLINIFIGATATSDNEFPTTVSPGKVGTLTVDAGFTYTLQGSGTTKDLVLNASNGALVVPTGVNLTVTNNITNNGTLTVGNNANLIQTSVVDGNTGSGTAIVNRDSNALYRLDYTLWSSPVSGQNLKSFSPATVSDRFFTYNSGTNLYNAVDPISNAFSAGTGYLIRMRNSGSATYEAGTTTLTHSGVFTGSLNNGNVTVSGLTAGQFVAVGNPYPSVVSANSFLVANSTNGTLYFWRKKNGALGTAYATYTLFGGTAGTSGPTPDGSIQVGQGFIVQANSTQLDFSNLLRETTPTSTQFLRTKKEAQKDRIWLNLTSTTGVFSQALVGYMDGATLGVDNGYDGEYINDSAIALTSNINGGEYVIQARPEFETSDIVPLSFKTDAAGDYTIAIDHVDGVFEAGQDVYLVDATSGVETNLTSNAYTFSAASGASNARFSLKYQTTLKVDELAFSDSSVGVYRDDNTLYINSEAGNISNVKVFDVQGKLLLEQNNVNSNKTSISSLKTHQVLIVQVGLGGNRVVSKKVIN